jgi:predicted Zn-dependent protease
MAPRLSFIRWRKSRGFSCTLLVVLLISGPSCSAQMAVSDATRLAQEPQTDGVPAAGSMPAADSLPAAGSMSAADSLPAAGSMPAADSVPAAGSMPAADSVPAAGSMPAADSLPAAGSMPAAGSLPGAGAAPVTDESSSTGGGASAGNAPARADVPSAETSPTTAPTLAPQKPQLDTSVPSSQPSGLYGVAPPHLSRPQDSGASPGAPTESMIPEFGKPLPAVQPSNTPSNNGQGWSTELTEQTPVSSDEEQRVLRLEQVAFGSTYPEHDMADRIGHLEEEVLKAKGSGPLDQRIGKVEVKVFGASAFGQAPPPKQSLGSLPPGQSPPPGQSAWQSAPPGQFAPPDQSTAPGQFAPPDQSAPTGQEQSTPPGQSAPPGHSIPPGKSGLQPPLVAQSVPPSKGGTPHTKPPTGSAPGSESLHKSDTTSTGGLKALKPIEDPTTTGAQTGSNPAPGQFAPLVPYTAPSSNPGQTAPPVSGFDPQAPQIKPGMPDPEPTQSQTPPPTYQSGNPQGRPPYNAPPAGYPGYPQSGYPPYGYRPPAAGYPPISGYPPNGAYPPAAGYPRGNYPPNYNPYQGQPPPNQYGTPYPGYRQPGQGLQPPGVIGGAPPYMASAAPPYGGYPGAPNPYGGYGVPRQPYPPTGQPYAAPPRNPQGMDPATTQTLVGGNAASEKVAAAIPLDGNAGDYFNSVRKFPGETTARWQTFPVCIHLPPNSPESWRRSLENDVKKWSEYVPLRIARETDISDIDVKWVNKLPPNNFGVTRVECTGGHLKITIYVLRPTFYPAEIPETTLQPVFLHELGHAVGVLGHSSSASDVMYTADEKAPKKGSSTPHALSLTARDLNTLKKVYSAPALPPTFQFQHPLEFSFN